MSDDKKKDRSAIPKFVDYRYSTNQNVVLRAVGNRNPEDDQYTGEVESLKGKLHFKMGDMYRRTKAPINKSKKKSNKKSSQRKEASGIVRIKKRNVLDTHIEIREDGYYQPTNERTRGYFEELLHFVSPFLGDVPSEVIHACANEVLKEMKSDNSGKFENVKFILNNLSKEDFTTLVRITKGIDDYFSVQDGMEDEEGNINNEDDEDEDEGVPLVFENDEMIDVENYGRGLDRGMSDFVVDENDEEEDHGVETESGHTLSFRGKKKGVMEKGGGGHEKMEIDGGAEMVNVNIKKRMKEKEVELVDEMFVDGLLKKYYFEENVRAEKTKIVYEILGDMKRSEMECENDIVESLDFHMDLVGPLLSHRFQLIFHKKYKENLENVENLQKIRKVMKEKGLIRLLKSLEKKYSNKMDIDQISVDNKNKIELLDLESLSFDEGSHLMTNKDVTIPDNMTRSKFKGYEEIFIPAPKYPKRRKNEVVIYVKDLPKWTHGIFVNINALNRIQCIVYKTAFGSDENVLVCAPTGAGKTIIAVLTILRELSKHIEVDEDGDFVRLKTDAKFKIIYIAPMKALVQEIVGKLKGRFKNLVVNELTGDSSLTRHQISESHIIVSTPEKWDIVTRKSEDRTFVDYVRLIIFDEIHLLHDERGPVLEAIVSRTLRYQDEFSSLREKIRFLGISATLPNYMDVARFLRVPKRGLFHFGNMYRPVPLEQFYIGISERKILKKRKLMNEICYNKVIERMEKSDEIQIIIFTHSRKQTYETAKFIKDLAIERNKEHLFLEGKKASKEIIRMEIEKIRNFNLKELLPHGFGIHHAGMIREDRSLVENLFDQKHIRVLCSTATLAWGVNLPAHTVIIKGTQIYSPELGRWVELSALDIMQMIGRAGRPGKDTEGEGMVITSQQELLYYLSLFNQQLPIESQLIKKLNDHLNAEIVMGSITNMEEAINWLKYSYLFIRMKNNKKLYQIEDEDENEKDSAIIRRCRNLVHSSAILLNKYGLIKYDIGEQIFQPTEIGRISSHYYIPSSSISIYNKYMKPHISDIDIFHVFSLSEEFKFMVVRQEEKIELTKLYQLVPIPIKETPDEPICKINILLQCYISRIPLTSFSLISDLTYITQSAVRIFRGLFEISLVKRWANLTTKLLEISKMIEKRMWAVQCPLRQFLNLNNVARGGLNNKIIYQLEKKDISWERLYDLSVAELGELVHFPQRGREIYKKIHQFPRLEVTANIQPVSYDMIQFEVILQADFEYNERIHGPALLFYIFIEDSNQEKILYFDHFLLQKARISEEHYLSFSVFLKKKLKNPIFFIRVISDRWLGCETVLPIFMKNFILPKKQKEKDFITEEIVEKNFVLNEKVLNFKSKESKILSKFGLPVTLNSYQSQVFPEIFYNSSENLFIGSPMNSNVLQLIEILFYRILCEKSDANTDEDEEDTKMNKIVYISPFAEKLGKNYNRWKNLFEFDEENIAILKGIDNLVDLRSLLQCKIVLCTPRVFSYFTKKWNKYVGPIFSRIKLVLVDDLYIIGGGRFIGKHREINNQGNFMEIVITHLKFIRKQLVNTNMEDEKDEKKEKKEEDFFKIIALSLPITCPKDIAFFLDTKKWYNFRCKNNIFNNNTNEIFVVPSFHKKINFTSRILSMIRKISIIFFSTIKNSINDSRKQKKFLVICPSEKVCKLSAKEIIYYLKIFKGKEFDYMENQNVLNLPISSEKLNYFINKTYYYNCPFITKSLPKEVRELIIRQFLFKEEDKSNSNLIPKFLFVSNTFNIGKFLNSKKEYNEFDVIYLSSEYYENHRFQSYSILQLYNFFYGYRRFPKLRVFLLCSNNSKEYYSKFLVKYPFLPIESQIDHFFIEHLNKEVVNDNISNFQNVIDFISKTFFFRRLIKNPNYYNLHLNEKTIRLNALQNSSNIINKEILEEFVSQFVEGNIEDLLNCKCVDIIEEEDNEEIKIVSLNLGKICNEFNLLSSTIDLFDSSLTKNTKLRGILEIFVNGSELEYLIGEDDSLDVTYDKEFQRFLKYVPYSINLGESDEIELTKKINVLLQSYFSNLISKGSKFNKIILKLIRTFVPDYINGMLNIVSCSNHNFLLPCLYCLEFSQMMHQGIWYNDSYLKQIPVVKNSEKLIKVLNEKHGIENIFDFMEMDEDKRTGLFNEFKIEQGDIEKIANFVNSYPNVDVEFEHQVVEQKETEETKKFIVLNISLMIDEDDDEDEEEGEDDEEEKEEIDTTVQGSRLFKKCFKGDKKIIWWIIVGDRKDNVLFKLKQVKNLSKSKNIKMVIPLTEELVSERNELDLTLYLMCDSYAGCDQEYQFKVKVE